jgi:hemoglobin
MKISLPLSSRVSRVLPNFYKLVALLMVFAIALTSIIEDAEAKRRRKKKRNRVKKQVVNEPKLFERMGGARVVSEIVDDWMRISFSDSRTSAEFITVTSRPERIAKLRKELNDRLCEIADGPCAVRPILAATAPEGMKAEEEVFLAHAENLLIAMQNRGLGEREKNEMLGRVGEFRSELIEAAPSTDQ